MILMLTKAAPCAISENRKIGEHITMAAILLAIRKMEFSANHQGELCMRFYSLENNKSFINGVDECLPHVKIPAYVHTIGTATFMEQTVLQSIKMNNGLQTIGPQAFFDCINLSEVTIPDTVTVIGNQAFIYCASLKTIKLPESLTELGAEAFEACTNLERIVIPRGVKTIQLNTFYACEYLKEVVLPEGLLTIEFSAFANCKSLKKIIIPESVTTIADDAFAGDKGLIIHGKTNSYAERYAAKHGFTFLPIATKNVNHQYKNKSDLLGLQIALELAISIGFMVLFWRMLPTSTSAKLLIFSVSGVFIVLLVSLFSSYLNYFECASSPRTTLIITAIVFLMFPLAINITQNVHEKDYLVSYPSDGKVSVSITYDIDRTGGSGSIGSDWSYHHYLNDHEFKNGDVLTIRADSAFVIKSRFIERDSIDDIGETISSKYKYSTNENYKKTLVIPQKVHVVENGGKRYAGSTADFKVVYTLKRVVPPSMNFWDILLYSNDSAKHAFCIFLILGQAFSIITIVYVLVLGNKKKAIVVENERRAKEQELLAEKNAFIASLHGQSIRQAAGVPRSVTFLNGLPKDNNDAQYGSFTVYCSNNGSCYHDKAGCCSARRPVHYFNAKNRFRPCSKCCTKHRSVPQWYIDYNSLKEQAQKHQIDVVE